MKINNNIIKVAGMIIFSVAFFISTFSLDIEKNIDFKWKNILVSPFPEHCCNN
jgi:hypothetical protein